MLTKWSIDVVPLSIAIEDQIQYEDVTDLIPVKYTSTQRRVNSFGNNNLQRNKFNNWKPKFNNNEISDDDIKYNNDSFNNDWDYTDVTDEDVENLLNSSNKSDKKKKKPLLEDDEEVIFVSESQKQKTNSDDLNENYKETSFSNEEFTTIKTNKKTNVSIDEFFDSMEDETTKKKSKKDNKFSKSTKSKNSESKKEKKKIDVLEEYDDISVDDYDDSLDIELDDIDYDEFE